MNAGSSSDEPLSAGIEVQVASRLAIVKLNQPARRNAISLAMWKGLANTFERLSADPEVRAIILTGEGNDFSVGADISEFARERADARQATEYESAVDACTEAIQASKRPTIAALHGYCLGGACHLALACDFRIGAGTLKMGIPAARLSIVYGVRSTQRLLSIVGLSAAKRILFAAEQLPGVEALRLGLIDRLANSAVEEARAFAAPMIENAPLSIAGAKTILNALASGSGTLDPIVAETLIAQAAQSEDYSEGRNAFAAKRKPDFKGR